jgi:phage FluMu protein Com
MITVTCDGCGKKLCEADIQHGEVRIKCKCGNVQTYVINEVKPAGLLVRVPQSPTKQPGKE